MKVIVRAIAALSLTLALVPVALAQGKGEFKGGYYSKGGESKGGDETYSVPEPSTIALLGLGIAGVVFFARRRKK